MYSDVCLNEGTAMLHKRQDSILIQNLKHKRLILGTKQLKILGLCLS